MLHLLAQVDVLGRATLALLRFQHPVQGWRGGAERRFVSCKHVRSLGKISAAKIMPRHAAACFYLHMWVPALLWEIELTNKRQHAQHCWAELITFTIWIVCSGFVDIHHSQMAQSVVAHMQTVLCVDVAHQTERSLNMASRAWSSDRENSNATQRRKIVFFGCTQVQLVLAVGR